MKTCWFVSALGLATMFAACSKEPLNELTPSPNGIAAERCLRPTNLTASELRGASAELAWEYEAETASFLVRVFAGDGQPEMLYKEIYASGNSLTVTGLRPEQNYMFQVQAHGDGISLSEWSGRSVFNSGALLYAPPTGIRFQPLLSEHVNFDWNAVRNANSYIVEVQRVSFLPVPVIETVVRETSLLLSDLRVAVPYRMRIAASGPLGQGAWTEWTTFFYNPPLPYEVDTK